MQITILLILIPITLILLVWIGLRVKPKPFPRYPDSTPTFETMDLPMDLPAPVARFYRTIFGEQIPIIHSAVITGSARMRVFGIRFPARFRFTHLAGQDYRHYIEATLFDLPVMKVNECYLEGNSRLELPFGVVDNEPKIDMAANLGLWAESVWLPPIFLTDPRVRWEAIDDITARLIVPFGDDEDEFIVTFDPQDGLIRKLETLRWKNANDEDKTGWLNETHGWDTIQGIKIPSLGNATWLDEGSPWAMFKVEDIAYNVDVDDYVRAKGL